MHVQAPAKSRSLGFLALILTLCASSALAGVNRWTAHWPYNVGVNGLAIDPTNSDVVFAATTTGVFKTENGGLYWSDPSNGALDGVNVHPVAIDPLQPSTVYAGSKNGILASTNDGSSWSNRFTAALAIYNIVFTSEVTAYAADFDDVSYYPGPSALYTSSDRGMTWNSGPHVFTMIPGTLVVDPKQPTTLYVGTYEGGGFRKSTDGGSTWSQPTSQFRFGVTSLAIDPQNSTTIYAGTFGGIYKSVDSGSTWSLVSGANLANDAANALAVDPRNPSTIYAATDSLGVLR